MPDSEYIQRLTWSETRPALLKLRPDLTALLDEYELDDSYHFYKVRYPFGSHILKNSLFHLPDQDGIMRPLAEFPETLQKDLAYNAPSHPSGIIMTKSLEQFVSLHERIIPFYLINTGSLIGIAALLDRLSIAREGLYTSFSMWEITAGARSTFLLSRISDMNSFKKLQRKYSLHAKQPDSAYDQWALFRELSNKENSTWRTEVIYFPRQLMEKLSLKPYAPLLTFLHAESRKPFSFWLNQFSWQVTLSHIERMKHLKYSVHLLDTVKHLLALALGALPAFQPSTNENCLPSRLIQKIFIEEYQIEHLPALIEPAVFNGSYPVYYSLSYPTSVEYSAKSSASSTNIADLEQLQIILDKFLKTLNQNEIDFSHSLLQRIARETEFEFFHSQNANYNKMLSIDNLLEQDPRFLQLEVKNEAANLEFPKNSSFFKGCISISKIRDINIVTC